MKKHDIISALKTGAAPAILGLALVSAPAMAQEAQADETAEDGEPQIIVTGTRLNNPNLENSSPVSVVTADEIDLRQANVVDDFLREIPGVTPSIGAQVNNGNGGSTFVDLRGLGANRNITLLNGTRVVPAGLAGITNIDVIPVALIERVDVLTGGAGSAYGADAITGVVNFITKDDFSGFDFSITNGITEQGDGDTFRADLTIGANFDDGRGNAVLSVGYTDRDAVFQGDRPFSNTQISSTSGNPAGSSTTVPIRINGAGVNGIAGFVTIDPDTGAEVADNFLQINPASGLLEEFGTTFNFNPFNLLQLPLEQFRIYGSASYELTDGIEAYAEALFTQNTNRTIIAPSGSFGNSVTVPLSNPFLPAGARNQICGRDTQLFVPAVADDPATPEDESAPAVSAPGVVEPLFTQAECDAAALATDPDDPNFRSFTFSTGRRFVELGTRDNERETRLFQIKAGLRGGLFSNLEWDLFGAYGESDLRSQQSGNGTLSRLQQSAFASSATQCIDPSNGCVPINLFGEVGTITPEVAAFLDIGNSASTFTSLAQVQGFISGDFGATSPWAAEPISIVVGGEFREYVAGTASDLLTQTPSEVLGNGAANPDSIGSYDVYEAFTEIVAPIVSDKAFFEELTLQLGARVSEYSTTGTEFTWKVGGTWTPVNGFQIRGNYQQVTRAPNIGELFSPQVTGLDNNDFDPCQGNIPLTNTALAAVCLAQGAPTTSLGSIIPDPAGQVNVTTGGNLNLASEDADTWTIGVVIQPDSIPGLSVTIDYYNITITDAITNPTVRDVLAACFGPTFDSGSGNTPPDGSGIAVDAASATDPACTSIGRNPDSGNLFGPVAFTSGLPQVLSNQGRLETDGIDASINYRREFDFATLNLSFNGNWTNSNSFDSNTFDPTNDVIECAGFFGVNCGSITPDFQFSQRTTLQFDDIDVSLLYRYIDGVEIDPLVAGNFQPEFESIGAESYLDLTIRGQVTDNFQVTASIINLLDNDPPEVGNTIGTTAFNTGNTFPSTYDPLGRRFSVTGRITF